jgi:hypothetical protein
VTTSGHVTPHGQFPVRSLPNPCERRGDEYMWFNVASITVAAGVPPLNAAGYARRYLLRAQPKRTADYKLSNIRKESKT